MILSLHLVNFELHEDTLIEFVKGVNIIRGSTGQGKTSIRRALTYVAFSKPVQGRPNDKSKDSYVTLRCSGIPAITRGRTGGKKGKNYYKIDSKLVSGEEQDPLKAFKRTVPPEIVQMLDMSEVNIQEQFKEYYLLQSTAGQVAKTIHKLLGMDLVDKTARVANSAIIAQGKLLVSRKTQIENIEADIKKYAYVESLESELDDLETAIQEYEELEARHHNLTTLLERCKILQQRIAATKVPELVETNARALMTDILEFNTRQEEFDGLHTAVKAIDQITKRQRELAEWLQVETEAIKLQNEIIDLQTQGVRSQRLKELIEQLQENQTKTDNICKVINYNNKELATLKKKLKICPVCKKPFGSKKHEHL
jgi:exonuclease SbcC